MNKYTQIMRFIFSLSFILGLPLLVSAAGLQFPGRVLGEATSAYQYESGSLVNDKGTIYFINGTVKIPFTNFEAFKGLGYSLNNVIVGDLSNYTSAKTYFMTTANAEHPWGSWLLHNGTVYYSHEQGLIPISRWEIFLANGGKSHFIVKANEYDLKVLTNKGSLPLLGNSDARVSSQQIGGVIQKTLLPENSGVTEISKIDCMYTSPPTGFHYEGEDGQYFCGKYLVADVLSNCVSNSSCGGVINSTTTPPIATSTAALPVISSISPVIGTVGTEVTLTGINFTPVGNTVAFAQGVIPDIVSLAQGTQIKFIVPDFLNSACYYLKINCLIAATKVLPGKYNLRVSNSNGTSNSLSFEISEGTCPGPILCAAPPVGYTYTGGGQCSCGTLVPIEGSKACLLPISCPNPPPGYYYLGGDTCTCGQLVAGVELDN